MAATDTHLSPTSPLLHNAELFLDVSTIDENSILILFGTIKATLLSGTPLVPIYIKQQPTENRMELPLP